jgi:SAM-dependent methyltransferase
MPTPFTLRDFPYTRFPAGSRVLDVGFGKGEQMRALRTTGCLAIGVEPDPARVFAGGTDGLTVCRGVAEHLPFVNGAFDGVVCKVVVPYTDESKVIAEISRVLRPGGLARVSYHGLGYALHVLMEPDWKRRIYAARTLVNSWVYSVLGKRLPGFLGSALYQSRRRLNQYYDRAGLQLLEDTNAPRFLRAPVFIYHTLQKVE